MVKKNDMLLHSACAPGIITDRDYVLLWAVTGFISRCRNRRSIQIYVDFSNLKSLI